MTPADAMRDLETTVCEGGEFGCVCMKGWALGVEVVAIPAIHTFQHDSITGWAMICISPMAAPGIGWEEE